jgi:flavin-dependent dehydrogenase
MASVCVVGAGPAGCTFAARMAQLGHDVRLIERGRFPRRRLGESLSPGTMPLLRAANLHEPIEAADFPRVRRIWMKWADGPQWRDDPRQQGLLVDRGRFDMRLVERVRAFGVTVHQPARIIERVWRAGKWRIALDLDGLQILIEADFLADAGGRRDRSARRRTRAGARTLAVYAYWRGTSLPAAPQIEAGEDAWFWGVPLPDQTYNTLAFVDPKSFRSVPGSSLGQRFLTLLGRSSLMRNCRDAEPSGPVRAIDATPYLADDCVAPNTIRLGDAALAIDPISSSGVQKAIASALSGAVVANTLLRRPNSAPAAFGFYRAQLSDASERHRRWTAEHYGAVADKNGHSFWRERAVVKRGAPEPKPPSSAPVDARAMTGMPVRLCRDAALVHTPCLDGDFVGVTEALHHPGLERPVAYLGGWELAPLLRRLPAGRTPLQIAQSWSNLMPLDCGLAIAGWLVNHGVLVGTANQGRSSPW